MTSLERPGAPLTSEAMEDRLRSLSRSSPGDFGVDDLELKHLLEILTRSSLLLSDGYDPGTLGRILRGEPRAASLFDAFPGRADESQDERRFRVFNVPDTLKTYGDKCLYDVGLAGRQMFRGVDLKTLGPRSYSLASQVLALLAEDRALRDFFDRNRMERLPIEEEILFLRQCASRFQIYARILQAFRGPGEIPAIPSSPNRPASWDETSPIPRARIETPVATSAEPRRHPGSSPSRKSAAPAEDDPPHRREEDVRFSAEGLRGADREERLARYERAILFSALDLGDLRVRLRAAVVDQDEAVSRICDDLAVFALGTQSRPRPHSYLLAGPTGVGKNYLIESLVRLLEDAWGIEIPILLIEGPQYTYPSDVSELKGSTRGFIRSDEQGLLAEFHERARKAPLSFLVVDEIEKAHAQLHRFFLSLMDRGSTMDNKGRLLRFPATVLAYTSNLGYSEEQMRGDPIGYGAARRGPGRRGAASRHLKRGLPPEFLNRLRVIHFAALSRGSAERILDQEIGRIAARYQALHAIELLVSLAAHAALVDRGFSEEYGARHLVEQADRILNVEVSLRLQEFTPGLSEEGRCLLARIREARDGGRAIDEEALRSAVARETRLVGPVARVAVDWSEGGFVYRVDRG